MQMCSDNENDVNCCCRFGWVLLYYFYTYASSLSILWPLLCGGGKECGFIAAKQHVLLFTGLELQVGLGNYLFSDAKLDSISKLQHPSA